MLDPEPAATGLGGRFRAVLRGVFVSRNGLVTGNLQSAWGLNLKGRGCSSELVSL